jgi:hypothetical protein
MGEIHERRDLAGEVVGVGKQREQRYAGRCPTRMIDKSLISRGSTDGKCFALAIDAGRIPALSKSSGSDVTLALQHVY